MGGKRDKKTTLTAKALAFAHEYIVDYNGTAAARRAGYNQAVTSLGTTAYGLLKKPEVLAIIEKLEKEKFKRVQASADKVVAEWANMGFSDIGNVTWMAGEEDSKGRAVHVEGSSCADECPGPHDGSIKSLAEMTPAVRRTIRRYRFDDEGRPDIEFHEKTTYHTLLGKKHKLLTDRVEINNKASLADRLKKARTRVGL